ncbi:MAG: hypothetical protein A4E35_00843 [Methanoregula sp. PtaU1.Bin051]|nr:MAG: hypothetical protein A4E35_00843 [Methanoregula sp. PtaU1.Bin051]
MHVNRNAGATTSAAEGKHEKEIVMEGWNKSEKTLLIIGVFIIAAVLVGTVVYFIGMPMVQRSIEQAKHAAYEAKLKDDMTIIPPKGSDLDIAGRWVDAISYQWTGKPAFEYVFKTDGTYTFRYTERSSVTTGKWGRLKGSNQLVTKRDSDTYEFSSGSPLRTDSSGRLFCDGFALVRMY